MQKLSIKGSDEIPTVILDKDKGVFKITGKSFMEDAVAFYNPVMDWINAYSKNPNSKTVFEFGLEYLNTASSKLVLDILNILNGIHQSGHKISIKWIYYEDDEDSEELGQEYAGIFELPFEFVTQ